MQFVIGMLCVWHHGPAFRFYLANCYTRNAIACRGGHYRNLDFRGFRENHTVIYVPCNAS